MRRCIIIASCLVALVLLTDCATQRKVRTLNETGLAASLQLPGDKPMVEDINAEGFGIRERDTIVVIDDDTGAKMILMNAVQDENGEMVAQDVLPAASVTARFRHVAERGGRVDLEFQIVVPEKLQDSKWQLRFNPDMYLLGDSLRFDPVIITGKDYRKAQLRGYQQYHRWLSTIVMDTTRFVREFQLEVFLRRNLPQIYAFRNDTTFVSDEAFSSAFGVTEREAIDHYTMQLAKRVNERRYGKRDRMFAKYVKAPIVTEGLRLDTVIHAVNGDFIYNYVQTVNTRPQLRKVDIVLSGDIYEQEKRVYVIPRTEPLTFYISSISGLLDDRERYMTKVIERRVEANTACWIDFELGRDEVKENLSNNATEIGRIKSNIASLIENRDFDLDSIVVTASASPEGSFSSNKALSKRRSESVTKYFDRYIRDYRDSLERKSGFSIDYDSGKTTKNRTTSRIAFISRNNPENWEMLDHLVESDTELSEHEKEEYRRLSAIQNLDEREALMANESSYRYLREHLYPRLRTVRFDFHLHRKGMVQDTVHTTVIDSVYMYGVQALRDHDYPKAVTLLRPYGDYNAAVAFCAMDYNASAYEILMTLDKTAEVNYMLALVCSRRGDEQNAVQYYLRACKQNSSYIHRGGLDPEIVALIRKYGLNRQDDIPTDFD